jgi:hypothetical protein
MVMTFLRNPYFLAALLFLVLGCFGVAVSWMTGLMLLVIAFFCAFVGVTMGMLRTRHQGPRASDGAIRLRDVQD